MLPISTKTPHRFEVPGDPPTVYLIKVPSRRERIEFECELLAKGIRLDSDRDLFAIARDGIRAIVAPEQVDDLLALIDEVEAIPFPRDDMPKDLADSFDLVCRTLRERYQRFAMVEASRARYLSLAPLHAAAMFLIGREGEAPFPRRAGLIPDEALEGISDAHLMLIGYKAMELMRPSERDAKNSGSGSPSSASPTPSETTSPTPSGNEDGRSAEITTSETPATT